MPETPTRHESQLKLLAQLDQIKQSILDLPPDISARSYDLSEPIIWLEYEDFRTVFSGQEVDRDPVDGTLSIRHGGARFWSVGPKPNVTRDKVTL